MSAQLHLIKLAVGSEAISDLIAWQEQALRRRGELVHVTRQTPKRAEELLDGGSLYWVVKGMIAARQRLIALRPLEVDGVSHCAIVYDPALIRVAPRPRRPFQGWRYLTAADAPPDLSAQGPQDDDIPEDMLRELAELGFL